MRTPFLSLPQPMRINTARHALARRGPAAAPMRRTMHIISCRCCCSAPCRRHASTTQHPQPQGCLGASRLRACPPPFHQGLLLREAQTREASMSSQDRGRGTVAPRPQFASAQRQQQRELAAVSSPCSRAAAGKWMKVGIVSGGEAHEESWLVTAPSRTN